MTQIVDIDAGGIELTLPIFFTDTKMSDITDDQVEVSLGTYAAPTDWVTPDSITRPTDDSVSAQLLIGGDLKPAAGDYWVWMRLTDDPERIPRRGINRVRVVNSGDVTDEIDGGDAYSTYDTEIDGGGA